MKVLIDKDEFQLSIVEKHDFYSLNRKTSDDREAFTIICPNCISSDLQIEDITEERGYAEIMFGCQSCGCEFTIEIHTVNAGE